MAKRSWFSLAGTGLIFMGLLLLRCTGASSGSSATTVSADRTIASYTTATATANNSCYLNTIDTTSCQSARTTLGLSGEWLKFSCNVVLGLVGSDGTTPVTSYSSASYITVTFVDLPDYSSYYYPSSGTYSFTANSLTVGGSYSTLRNTSVTPTYNDPNTIAKQSVTMNIPKTPGSTGTTTMDMGMVGVSINGIAIYDNVAASTDNIFAETGSFDTCQGHPSAENGGTYHYHSEPYSLSYDDNSLIGVMRDGYFIYGRRDHDNSDQSQNWSSTTDNLYKYGGHSGLRPSDAGTTVFHYHATLWSGCYHQNSGSHYYDDGANTCASGQGGTTVNAYFLTGHGNGGVFASTPTWSGTHYGGYPATEQTTNAVRYYYGTPGACTGCN